MAEGLNFFLYFFFSYFFFFLFLRKSTKPPCTRLVWTYNNTECTFNQNLYKITNLSRVVFLTTSKTAVELYCNLSCNKKIAIPLENLHPSVKKITSSSIWWFSNSSCFSNSKCHQGSVRWNTVVRTKHVTHLQFQMLMKRHAQYNSILSSGVPIQFYHRF